MLDSASTRGVINLNSKPRMLLVDDVPDNLRLLSTLFDESELELSFAKNGIRALKLAELSKFEVAILDINLPDINGFELAKRIRQIQPECELIFCSAHNDRENREKGFLLGAIDFIEKPYDLDITRSRIRLHIERILLRRSIAVERDRMDAILENIHDAVITVNAQEIIVGWNDGAEGIFGVDNTIIGKPLSLLFPETAQYRSFTEMINDNPKDQRGNTRVVSEMQVWKGDPFMAEVSLSPPYEANETLHTGLVRKIADSVTTRQQASLFHQALEHSDVPYLMLSNDGVILEQSTSFNRMAQSLNLGCNSVGHRLGSCLMGSVFDRLKRGERHIACVVPCDESALHISVFEDDGHRSAYLLLFKQNG